MQNHLRIPAISVFALALLSTPVTQGSEFRGYTASSATTQKDWEGRFRAIPDPVRLRSALERLSLHPHHVGSPWGKSNAEWLRDQFASYGWDAKIEEYRVLFPTPRERRVELVEPTRFVAKLEEPVIPNDPSTSQRTEQLPTYNSYSGEGDVTAPLVYVNYGVPADYEELDRRGISVRGAIVIARYGGSWRGIKPKLAAEKGAIGCIIYSDPRDDGYAQGDVYPAGPFRPKDGVQRGSVLDLPVAPGDPLTVGTGATADAPRIDRSAATTIMKIPVLPISYGDAQPLLAALGGPVVPDAWRGALPITYKMGPGPAKVRLKAEFNWALTPVYNVVATLRGSELPDEWVIRGNHHDGWVNGAEDPLAGMIAELEEARALGELVKQGWRPKRTIVYTAWDAEEPALLGSTEWAEHHGAELQQKAVLYINTDGNGRGYLGAGGSHSLERLVNQVARVVDDPESRQTVWRRAQAARIRFGTPVQRREARERGDLRIDALGSGSDYTPFLQHLGVATLNIGFGGEDARRHLPLDLRHVQLVHAVQRHVVRVRAGAGAGGGHDGDARGERGPRAVRIRRAGRDVARLRDGAEGAARGGGGPHRRNEPAAGRRRAGRDGRPETSRAPARARGAGAVPELRPAGQRRRIAGPGRGPVRTRAGVGVRRERRPGDGRGRERHAEGCRAPVDVRAGTAPASMVPAPAVRARLLHGVRREDDAGRA